MTSFRWIETSSGRFERDLDANELLFVGFNLKAPTIRENFAVLGGLTFSHSYEDIDYRFRNAWLSVRYHHPSLVVSIENGKKVYQVPSKVDIASWLSRTFIVTARDPREELPTLGQGREATLYLLPEEKQVIIHCPHDRIDGFGMMFLLNNLMKAVAHPEIVRFGKEAQNLTASMHVATNATPTTKQEQDEVISLLKKFGEVTANEPIGLASLPEGSSGKFHRSHMTVSKSDTCRIIKATRALGLTMTQAVQVALVMTTRMLGHDSKLSAIVFSQNIRPQLLAPFKNSALHPAACFICPHTATFENKSDFKSTAEQIKAIYRGIAADKATTRKAIVIGENFPKLLMGSKSKSGSKASVTRLSSMGILENIFDADIPGLKIESPWLATDNLLTDTVIHFWTWHEQLHFALSYNEGFYEKEAIEEFVPLLYKILIKGLNLGV